ncbi:MAG TPA: energy transducer TonB [Candidatus Sulfotelmatobacter sp.]|nr:energy transducer TonB [Candidatus Sulfotelmatobacter sp.]
MRSGVLILTFLVVFSSVAAHAQSTTVASGSERKIASRVAPAYPELAKKMHIHGVVRIEAVVRPNGSVKSTRVIGGNPVLVEAAQDAVGKWKFEPAQNETTEVVQLAFEGQ